MKRIFNFKNGNVNGNGNEFARAVTTSKKSKRNFCYQKQKNFALQKEKKNQQKSITKNVIKQKKIDEEVRAAAEMA